MARYRKFGFYMLLAMVCLTITLVWSPDAMAAIDDLNAGVDNTKKLFKNVFSFVMLAFSALGFIFAGYNIFKLITRKPNADSDPSEVSIFRRVINVVLAAILSVIMAFVGITSNTFVAEKQNAQELLSE
jgi:hypothetical protein